MAFFKEILKSRASFLLDYRVSGHFQPNFVISVCLQVSIAPKKHLKRSSVDLVKHQINDNPGDRYVQPDWINQACKSPVIVEPTF